MQDYSLLEKAIHLGQLIGKFLLQKTSPEENSQLEQWQQKTAKHQQLIQDICSEQLLQNRFALYQRIDPQEEWKKLHLPSSSPSRLYRRIAIAASILILFPISSYWFLKTTSQPPSANLSEVLPGNYKAILYTSQGKRIQIKNNLNLFVHSDSSIQITNNQITYKSSNFKNNSFTIKDSLNTLEVPRGGEFKILLADGTEIWINSGSTLKYPTTFNTTSRMVELAGEAYFKVSHYKSTPFLVKTDKSIIQVYGTAFNVCAYPEDPFQYTTLEQGSIGLRIRGKEKRLIPGEQAQVNENGLLTICKVDATKYGNWRNGVFLFEKEELATMMQKLARWYDVKVFFKDEKLKHLHFTGELNRYEQIEQILEMLELTTHISFSIQNRTVFIESK